MAIELAIKLDVDTERGTRIGVPNLLKLFQEERVPATFYFSLGPDHTGRAIQRIFRRGFFQKCARTNVVGTYGIRTLLNGVLLPGPHIAKRHAELLRNVKSAGFPVGIHAYDHQKWQDGVQRLPYSTLSTEFAKALAEFKRVWGMSAPTAAAPGWQANDHTLAIYDQAQLLYASDCRGTTPFYPAVAGKRYATLQIPTTLPTLDELVGRAEFSEEEQLLNYYPTLLRDGQINVMTIHAELEGMKYLNWFRSFLQKLRRDRVIFRTLHEFALASENYPTHELIWGEVPGRSGKVALQGTVMPATVEGSHSAQTS